MSILIVGSEGSMGKRYQAILKYLGKDFFRMDLKYSDMNINHVAQHISGIILATPTSTHFELALKFLRYGKPILCEKPITKDLNELEILLKEVGNRPFKMMYQYQLLSQSLDGPSWYDYFRHGSDGLVWDCLQIIGLAKSTVDLSQKSPVWRCGINGYTLDLADMDRAYVDYVDQWLNHPDQDLEEIKEIHVKTSELARSGLYG